MTGLHWNAVLCVCITSSHFHADDDVVVLHCCYLVYVPPLRLLLPPFFETRKLIHFNYCNSISIINSRKTANAFNAKCICWCCSGHVTCKYEYSWLYCRFMAAFGLDYSKIPCALELFAYKLALSISHLIVMAICSTDLGAGVPDSHCTCVCQCMCVYVRHRIVRVRDNWMWQKHVEKVLLTRMITTENDDKAVRKMFTMFNEFHLAPAPVPLVISSVLILA